MPLVGCFYSDEQLLRQEPEERRFGFSLESKLSPVSKRTVATAVSRAHVTSGRPTTVEQCIMGARLNTLLYPSILLVGESDSDRHQRLTGCD